jgi:hypothetical protein
VIGDDGQVMLPLEDHELRDMCIDLLWGFSTETEGDLHDSAYRRLIPNYRYISVGN